MSEKQIDTPIVVAQASNAPYLIAVVILALVGIVATMGILILRPDKDNTLLLSQVATMIVPTLGAVLAFMKSEQTHLAVNSHLETFKSELIKLAEAQAELANREGVLQGTADEQARVLAGNVDIAIRPAGAVVDPEAKVVVPLHGPGGKPVG